MMPGGDVISLIGVKAADGTALTADQFQILDSKGTVTHIFLEGGAPSTAVDSIGASVNFEWNSDATGVHITTISSDGLVHTTMDIDLTETSTEKKPKFFNRRAPLGKPSYTREHQNVNKEQNQSKKKKMKRQTSPVADAAVAQVTVHSSEKNLPIVVGAHVYRDYKESTMQYSRRENYIGVETSSPGVFYISIPTVSTSTIGIKVGHVCNSIHKKLSELCTWYGRLKTLLQNSDKAFAYITNPEIIVCPQLRNPTFVATCVAVFKAFKWYCNKIAAPIIPTHKTVDDLGLNPLPEHGDVLCKLVTQHLDPAIDLFRDETILLTPYAIFPGNQMTSEGQVIKLTPGFTGLLPNNFAIVNDQNINPQIISLTVLPNDPAPFEHYVVTVGYVRATDDTVVHMSIHGTDSYYDDIHCYGVHAICVLHVPGAESLVEDTATVEISNPATGYVAKHTVYIRF